MNQILLAEATAEDKKSFGRELQAILLANGANHATKTRISHGSSRNDTIHVHGGLTYKWNADASEIIITRWANGDVFTPSRVTSASIYQDLLISVGFIVELKDKTLVVKGKVASNEK